MVDENNQTPPKNEPTPDNNDDDDILEKFNEIKQEYENDLQEKEKRIQELEQQLKDKENEVDQTIKGLNDEVKEKLAQTQEIKEMQETINTLMLERAETTVDTYIQKGVILPAQKKSAVKLCLNDNETFLDLYKDAKPIVNIDEKQSKQPPSDLIGKMSNYFKKN